MLIFTGPRKGMENYMQALRETRALLQVMTDPRVMAKLQENDRPENGVITIGIQVNDPAHTVTLQWEGDLQAISVVEKTRE